MAEQKTTSVHIITAINAKIDKILSWQEKADKKAEDDKKELMTLLTAMKEQISTKKAVTSLQRKSDKTTQTKTPVEKKDPPTAPVWFADLYVKNTEDAIAKFDMQSMVDQTKKEIAQVPKYKNITGDRMLSIEASAIFAKIYKENGNTKKLVSVAYNTFRKEYTEVEKKEDDTKNDESPDSKKEEKKVGKKEEKKDSKKDEKKDSKKEEKKDSKKEEKKDSKKEEKKNPEEVDDDKKEEDVDVDDEVGQDVDDEVGQDDDEEVEEPKKKPAIRGKK